MGASTTRRTAEQSAAAAARVAVAVSGGRDSMALLHATAAEAARIGVQVHALHVHHGLMPQADAWAEHVARICASWRRNRRWPLLFTMRRLAGAPAAGDSVEAWARRERYRALAEMAREAGASLVLLAHHRRDQAETFMLQALRGAGPAGLAAMPRSIERDGLGWARPWLDAPREAVEAYARRHRIRHVDDASNDDERFARNRLRLRVMPALVQAFPAAEAVLVQAAARCAEAQAVLQEIAGHDIGQVCSGGELLMREWAALTPARRRNVLRVWLAAQLGRGPAGTLIDRLMTELPRPGAGAWPAEGGELRLYRGRLSVAGPRRPMAAPAITLPLTITATGRYAVGEWRGSLLVDAAGDEGMPLACLRACELRARSGRERFQRAEGGTPRSLKKAFQFAGVPAWQRDGPLLYAGGSLVFVPGLGLDARAQAAAGAPRVTLRWQPDPPAPGR